MTQRSAPTDISEVIRDGNCISCGLCFSCHERTKLRHGCRVPDTTTANRKFPIGLCPGKGYDIERLAPPTSVETHYSLELGRWQLAGAFHSADPELLSYATSGGLMTGIAAFLLEHKRIDGAIVTRLVNRGQGIVSETFVATDKDSLRQAQGSKYMPVSALESLDKLILPDKKYLFIGTPCQIAGIRLLQQHEPRYRDQIVMTVGNFCGGFRDFREQQALLRRLGLKAEDVSEMSYRRGKQPGYMLLRDFSGREFHLPYPQYARMTGYLVMRRCRFCVDATAELADISCGDAWLERFLNQESSWSLSLARSNSGKMLLEEMIAVGALKFEPVTSVEIIQSQKTNLHSKKYRQHARRKLYSHLGCRLPEFNGGYDLSNCKISLEIKVLFSHLIFHLLEKFGLYHITARLLKRNKCKVEVIDNEKN